MKNTAPESPARRLCAKGSLIALPIALAAALSVSNGPAIGIAVGAGVGLVIWLNQRRKRDL